MAVQTDAYLKGRFITGAKPTETDFSDLIDSKRSVNDDLAISDVTGLQTALDNAGGGSVAWGDVTGTLSNQTDLNTALSGKSDTSHTHTAATTSAAGFMSSADKTKLNALNTTLQVPSGGTAGQFVRKGASAPEWADVIQVPTGGTDGQVLSKVSGSVAWADAGGGGGFSPDWEIINEGYMTGLVNITGLTGTRYKLYIALPERTNTFRLRVNGYTGGYNWLKTDLFRSTGDWSFANGANNSYFTDQSFQTTSIECEIYYESTATSGQRNFFFGYKCLNGTGGSEASLRFLNGQLNNKTDASITSIEFDFGGLAGTPKYYLLGSTI